MSWSTVIWSVGIGICLTMGSVHLLAWLRMRDSLENLAFALTSLSVAWLAAFELQAMHAQTPEQYANMVRWGHVACTSMICSLVWFIQLHLKCRRMWLFWSIIAVRALILIINFVVSPNISFAELSEIRLVPIWGELLAVPVGQRNPWQHLIRFDDVLFFLFLIDASMGALRQGLRKRTVLMITSIIGAFFIGVLLSMMMTASSLRGPMTISMPFLLFILIMGYELSQHLVQVRQLSSELEERQKRISLATDAAMLATWEWDILKGKIWINEGWEHVGLDQEHDLGFQRFVDTIHPDDQARVMTAFQQSLEENHELEVEYRLPTSNEKTRWISSRGRIDTDRIKNQQIMRGVSIDVSRMKETEQSLQGKSDYLEHILNSISDAVISVKLPERTIEWERDSFAVLGYNPEECVGKTTEFLYASQQAYLDVGTLLTEALDQGKETLLLETLLRRKNGQAIPVEISLTFFRQNDKPVSVTSLIRDITLRKQAEMALLASEQRLKEAQRIAKIGNWEHDLQTDKLAWSDEIFRIFQIQPDEFGATYAAFLALVHPDDRELIDRTYKHSLETGKPYDLTHRLLLPEGRIKFVRAQCEILYSSSGSALRSIGTMQDITESVKTENERQQLHHELTHFNRIMQMNELSTTLAHEINQPLGAIINNASAARILIRQGTDITGEFAGILDDIMQDAERAARIVRSIRSSIRKERVTHQAMDINDIILHVADLVKKSLLENQIALSLTLTPNPMIINGEKVSIQQVLINLITNGLDAMRNSPDKVLRIASKLQAKDTVLVSVIDSGTGIDRSVEAMIFEPFFTTKSDGLGMGMRISKTIIEEHAGQIWFEKNQGAGTTFSFSLPLIKGDAT